MLHVVRGAQELGETRQQMGLDLMRKIEKLINDHQNYADKYYILVHAKPWPSNPNMIKQKIIVTKVKPSMMLSCMLFGVDNKEGKLTLEWSLPGDWPVMEEAYTEENVVPEVVASIQKSGAVIFH